MSDTYRPTRINVERQRFGYMAWVILEDIAEPEPGEPPIMFRGLAMEHGPYYALTHRRVWKRALRWVRRHHGRLF